MRKLNSAARRLHGRVRASFISSTASSSSSNDGPITHPSESILSPTSSVYIESMLTAWSNDPSSVHPSWNSYFTNLSNNVGYDEGAFEPPSNLQPRAKPNSRRWGAKASDSLGISHLIRAYQSYGHR